MTPVLSAERTQGLFRPVWAEIDLAAFRRNVRAFRKRLSPGTKLLFVCKANGYGHGAVETARAALAEGAEWLGVTSVEEGASLRAAGVGAPILVLGSLYPFSSLEAAAELRLTPTIASADAARALIQLGTKLKRPLACHVKVETGMGRIGVRPTEALKVMGLLSESPRAARLEGLYTHLASADDDAPFTRLQLRRFQEVLAAAASRGLRVPLKHAANSMAALRYPESHFDMVRAGLALYGLCPGYEPVMSVKAKVVFLKRVPAGTPVSYGGTFRARKDARIATLPLGYADGVNRRLSNRGEVLIGGKACRIAGAVTMDMLMADVTRLREVHVGDEAVFLGRQGAAELSAAHIARRLGTIPYEVVCAVSARVPREYHG